MEKKYTYYKKIQRSPLEFVNIEEKQLIHELENKDLEINLERLEGKKKVNEIR
ncbi:hypothetical protein SAMN05660297_00530 [Natronincola peptidivorans]|uniref:Uncharacterized protein n=1 Tax=Natronincola peptidivorans TaxID=426128 RepID=A0A1H9Z3K3_9FIRM|nr:hypothetical protein [Natronincola peptidivorans]SES75986.1 hypothetical protein SAMN05660297_00530 [Natronincola peptidivorans]